MSETWRPIPGYEGIYSVSNQGSVKSLDRITDRGHRRKGKILTSITMKNGYHIVTLWRNGKQKSALVHRLVLFAFVGPQPEGMESRHKNGDKNNNSLSNLSWGTASENNLDIVVHGNHIHASKEHCPQGHPYDEENTYWYPGKPHRACRECRRENSRKWRAENPERWKEISRRAQQNYDKRRRKAA